MNILRKAKFYLLFFILVATFFATFCFSVNYAFASSPILTITAFDKEYCFYKYETSFYNGTRYLNDIDGVIDKIYLDTLIKPSNSIINFNPSNFSNPFSITESKSGRSIDKQQLKKDISFALNQNINLINCKTLTLNAEVTKQDNQNLICLRGEFSTDYSTSATSRKHNINLATKKINGIVLKSGEIFSFNQIVGERSEKNGFQNAKIIFNGEFVDGVGGGVCQVSTTLYNATLLSNLQVKEKHAHSLSVSYVAPSFDATVNSNSLDFKFINDTNSLIYIVSKSDGNTLSFKIYGEKNPYKIKRVSKINEKIQPLPCEYIKSDDLFIDEQKVLQYEKYGIKSQGVLEYFKDGKKIKEIIIRKDYYKPVNAKVLVGTKQKPQVVDQNEKQVDKIVGIR